MKLHSITMINSGNYSFAHIVLDAKSIQLAGRNNKGKTSLLWTLPLLLVVDRNQATEPGRTAKESLNFYFKNPDKSYIVFEGYDEKQGYFYMLLRRDGDNIKYYFVKKKFDCSMFTVYDDSTESYTVLPFSRVLENPETGIGTPLKDNREVLAKVITSKKGEVGFLRLTKESKSRQFSELYKHLFRSNSDSDILKNGILIVNSLNDEVLDMRKELPLSQLAEWKREQDEIDTLKGVLQDLDKLREKRNDVEAMKSALISELTIFEEIDFNQVRQSVSREDEAYRKQVEKLQSKIRSLEEEEKATRSQISKLDRYEGRIGGNILQLQQEIDSIGKYPDKIWLKQALHNNEEQFATIRTMIKAIDAVSSIEVPKKKLHQLKLKKKDIEQFINNAEETLLMNISSDKEEIGIINTVLSDAVTALPKSAILSNEVMLNQENTFSYNGAKIDISSLDIKNIPTIEERKRELLEVEQTIKETDAIIENFNKKENLEAEKKTLEDEIQKIRNQLSELSNLGEYNKNLANMQQELKQIGEERKNEEHKETSIILSKKQTTLEINKINEKIKSLSIKEEAIEKFYDKYKDYCNEIGFTPSESKAPSIDEISDLIQKKKEMLEQKYNEFKNSNNSYLFIEQMIERHTSKINLYDDVSDIEQDDLLTLLGRKCEHIDIKAKELQDKVVTSSSIFTAKVKRFLQQMESIKKFTSRINNMLSKYTISDLSGVHIRFVPNECQIEELEQLSSDNVSLFYKSKYDTTDQEEPILRYIRTEKTVPLSDLFEIVVERTKKEENSKRDRREKNKQSNGTERMLHVMLLMILLRELIHPEDTIPFLIDEVLHIDDINQEELLKFFDELNLLPISASPQVAHTFEKICHIEEDSSGKSYINKNTSTYKEGKEDA